MGQTVDGTGTADSTQTIDVGTAPVISGTVDSTQTIDGSQTIDSGVNPAGTYRPSQIFFSVQAKSSDGLYWPNYPQGNRPG